MAFARFKKEDFRSGFAVMEPTWCVCKRPRLIGTVGRNGNASNGLRELLVLWRKEGL
jgi:hypothetical protein